MLSNLKVKKPALSFWQIVNMNVGFLGIQYSFGLQQTVINPIFLFLGAQEEMLPLYNLAGPITGLVVQPIIGAISDKTWAPRWGRRKPFFLIGAILGSLCLFLYPFSPALWFAVGLLWLLDVGNNVAMEPYRAFVGDKLPEKQMNLGYQMQSLFVGAGILLANGFVIVFQRWLGGGEEVDGVIPQWLYYAFFIGSFLSLVTILWSVFTTPEIPPSDEELEEITEFNKGKPAPLIQVVSILVILFTLPVGLGYVLRNQFPVIFNDLNIWIFSILILCAVWFLFIFRVIKKNKSNAFIKSFGDALTPFLEVGDALKVMPNFMWRLAAVYLFQWYALFIYWQFITPMFRNTMGYDTSQATSQAATMNLSYNVVTMVVALILVPLTMRFGGKRVYALSLLGTGLALLAIPHIDDPILVLLPMVLFGIGWAAMMGIPYAMVSKIVPTERRGVYMGILNMMIVIPMFFQNITFGPIYKYLLGGNAVNAILTAGVMFVLAALFAFRLQDIRTGSSS